MSARMLASVVAATRSTTRIRAKHTADTRKLTASASSATGASASWTSAPPRPGPPMITTDVLAMSLPLASTSRSRSTIAAANTGSAAMNSTVSMPVTAATAMSWATVSRPSAQATGT